MQGCMLLAMGQAARQPANSSLQHSLSPAHLTTPCPIWPPDHPLPCPTTPRPPHHAHQVTSHQHIRHHALPT